MVFIFIAVILLAFIINLFGIISTKQQLDHAADQMVKQIQLSGGINFDTDELFDYLCSQVSGFWNFDLVNITVVARGAGVSDKTTVAKSPSLPASLSPASLCWSPS